MSTATETAVTVRIDPTANSLQSDVIGAATAKKAGAMTAAQVAKLDGLTPMGPGVTDVTGAAPVTSTGGDTPVIGITPATPSAAGSLSAADKTKLDLLTPGGVTSVTGTAPIASSGGATPNISIAPATGSTPGSLSAADKTKLDSVTSGAAVASVSGVAPITSTGGTTPAIGIVAATPSVPGSMSAADKAKLDGIPVGGGGIVEFAEFYGLTAGTGNAGPTDYAATIPVRTANGTGNVPFPRIECTVGTGITALTSATFQLAAIGIYLVSFRVHTTEPGQLQLCLNNTLLPSTCFPNMNPTGGGHPIGGTVIVTTVSINSVLEVVVPNSNSPALTITPADGASTHANAQTLTILRLR